MGMAIIGPLERREPILCDQNAAILTENATIRLKDTLPPTINESLRHFWGGGGLII